MSVFKVVTHTDCASCQAERNCIVTLRFGAWHVAFGTKRRFAERKRPKWFNPFPVIFEVWRPISQCDMREVFRVGCLWLNLSYTTKGETLPGHHRYGEAGLKLNGTIVRWIRKRILERQNATA